MRWRFSRPGRAAAGRKGQDAPIPPGFLRHPLHFLALGFGAGLLRPAPGTWGTLVGLALLLLTEHGLRGLGLANSFWAWQLGAVGLGFLAGIAICGKTAEHLNTPDHGSIVWDEIVGIWTALLFAPPGWGWLLAGFVLFRLFDVLKPWPIGWADSRLSGGFGIMADDLLAGLYALGVLQLAAALLG
ncbi:MAG: phosphatidylglycerophosphatase A [Cellvibrionales bacterium]|nr:phosphatidylglycerophosphatase A [Cellvibrionales bacterium]